MIKTELKIACWILFLIILVCGVVRLDMELIATFNTIHTIERQNKEMNKQLEEMNKRIPDINKQIKEMNTELYEMQNEVDRIKEEQDAFFTVNATAYTHNDPGCNKVTALGTTVKENRTLAVDPKVIPLGSKVKVVSNYPGVSGEYVAEDVGGGVKGGRVDIYMPSVSRAMQFGRRDVRIRVLEE